MSRPSNPTNPTLPPLPPNVVIEETPTFDVPRDPELMEILPAMMEIAQHEVGSL